MKDVRLVQVESKAGQFSVKGLVGGEQKALSLFIRFLLTTQGSDPYAPDVGTTLPRYIGAAVDLRTVEDVLATSVNTTVSQVNDRAVGSGERIYQHSLQDVALDGVTLRATLLVNGAIVALDLRS